MAGFLEQAESVAGFLEPAEPVAGFLEPAEPVAGVSSSVCPVRVPSTAFYKGVWGATRGEVLKPPPE